MRILHTSDWHLGHTLHGLPREYEHERFLAFLLDALVREEVDVLLICGDVFDTANPGAQATAAYYGFLARAAAACPSLQVVVLAGNHDSARRLDAPRDVLGHLRVHVVGEVREPDGALSPHLVVPLRDRTGAIAGWCAAVPFLRPGDLGAPVDGEGDPLIEGVRRLYRRVLDDARACRRPDQALVATGHCYMVGTEVSALSERRILGGNQHALPADLFGDDVDYVALGHLHKAQAVGREHVRYCGSPLPLSMAEADYRHQVLLVDFAGGRCAAVRALPVPRAVEMCRVPRRGAAPPDEVLAELAALPALADCEDPVLRPYLEVRVRLDAPAPDLRPRIEAQLDGRAPRLVKLTLEYPAERRALGDLATAQVLADLEPQDVFRSLWASRHAGDVPAPLLAAFHELVDAVARGEAVS